MQVLKDTLLQHLSLAPLEPDSLMPTLTVGVLPDDDQETQSEAPPDDVRVRPPKRPRSPTPCREGCVCLGGENLRQHHCCGGQNRCCKGGDHLGPHYCRLCLVSAVVEHCRQGQALLALQLQKDLGQFASMETAASGPEAALSPRGSD